MKKPNRFSQGDLKLWTRVSSEDVKNETDILKNTTKRPKQKQKSQISPLAKVLYADAVWLCAFLLPTFFAFTGLKNPMKPIQGQQAFWHCFLATTTDRIIVNRIIQGKFTNLEANIEMETLIEHEKRQLNLLEKSRDVGSDLLLQVQSTILNVVKADKVLYVSIVYL